VNSQAESTPYYELLAKLMGGDQLPYFDPFPNWNLMQAVGPHPAGDLKFVQTTCGHCCPTYEKDKV